MSNQIPTIVYCATREKDIKEAELSIKSVRKIYPSIEIILCTSFLDYQNKEIDYIQILKNKHDSFLDKISTLIEVKRKNILFLDGDTLLLDKVDDLFKILNQFDLAVAHAPNRWTVKLKQVPDAFPEFNTGVLLLKKNRRIRNLLKKWYNAYKKDLNMGKDFPSKDQPAFRKSLFESSVRFTTLTPEYNCRFSMGAMVSHNVKLLHGRSNDFDYIIENINQGPLNKYSEEPEIRWIKYK